MPPLQFCANLTWLFTEIPELSQRIYAAAAVGFRAVEAAWPYEEDLQELKSARDATGVELVLINTPPGNLRAGDLGLGAVPGREQEFRQGLERAIEYAQALQCKRIHLMAGRVPLGSHRAEVAQEMESIFIQNLEYAADLLSKKGITGLIEPINTRITDPAYFLDSPHHAVAILERVGRPNLKLQMDVFHWQIMDGNLTQNIIRYFPYIGHIQIAQVPERNEPDTPGELNYSYLWDVLERQHYQGFVGCEYRPLGGTITGLGWLKEYWTRKGDQEH
ncbi:putative hydroxypyruvate isomerase [Boleophthalmus pectinirostris]|uniref:putative hydroxypyruvate isomerase n=1 Tax=Boleophthalmus pectinirostris TaxID=150288 RepID=UPI000A1C2E6D|nr:putative hydroxypyruvate isomerase [Boleophthalmus pectinirostris]